jgi:hypothetical protein
LLRETKARTRSLATSRTTAAPRPRRRRCSTRRS